MALKQHHQRVEPHLFQARRIEECQVQARPNLGANHRRRQPDLLPLAFETRRRQGIGNLFVPKRAPESLGTLQHSRAATGSVARKRGIAARGPQLLGGVAQDHVHRRIIRADEGRQEFGGMSHPRPLGRRHQFAWGNRPASLPVRCRDGARDRCPHRLGQAQEDARIECCHHRRDGSRLTRPQPVDRERRHHEERRVRRHRDGQVRDVHRRGVAKFDRPEDGHPILVERDVQSRHDIQRDRHVWHCPPGIVRHRPTRVA